MLFFISPSPWSVYEKIVIFLIPVNQQKNLKFSYCGLIFRIYILYGKDYLSEEQNIDILWAVHNYIKHTHRFDWLQQVFASSFVFHVLLFTYYMYSYNCHDITEILLKVALNTITLPLYSYWHQFRVLLLYLLWNTYIYVAVMLKYLVNWIERALYNVIVTCVWSHLLWYYAKTKYDYFKTVYI